MNVTSKSRYAIKIMIDFAQQPSDSLLHRAEITRRQRIPADYFDQILARLRKAGLVKSIRGRNGGLKIAKNSNQISAWDIFVAVEDRMTPVRCLEVSSGCTFANDCTARDAWEDVVFVVQRSLSELKLSQMIRSPNQMKNLAVGADHLPWECKGASHVGEKRIETYVEH